MLTTERLRQVLTYNAKTGIFRRRLAYPNNMTPGQIAGRISTSGYRQIGIDGQKYAAHRLVWFYVYGKWPANTIDHINGNPDDNRISNLREATRSQNGANRRIQKGTKSGLKGVSWHRGTACWHARIMKEGKMFFLGEFVDPHVAHHAYQQAATRLFVEFARFV